MNRMKITALGVFLIPLLMTSAMADEASVAVTATTPEQKIVQTAPVVEPTFRDVAILPFVTTSVSAEVSKASWQTASDLFTAKGYRVIPLDKTLAAMRETEVFPTMFIQIERSQDNRSGTGGGEQRVTNVSTSDDWREGAMALCKALNVSKIIVAQVDSKSIKRKSNFFLKAATLGVLGDTKSVEVNMQAGAYGRKTGSQIWWAADADSKGASKVLFFAPSASSMLSPATQRTIARVFSGLFDQDRMAYGFSSGIVVKNVKAEKTGPMTMKIAWDVPDDAGIKGYNVYRAVGKGEFDPTPVGKVTQPVFEDTIKDLSLGKYFRYVVTAYNEADGESDYSQEAKAKL